MLKKGTFVVMLQSTKETIRDGRGLAWRSKHHKIKRTCGITKWIQIIFASWRWRLWMKMCYQWCFRMLPHTRKNPCETDLPINLSYICAGNARGFACFRLHCSLRTHTHTLKVFSEQQPDIKIKKSFRQDNVKTWCDFAMRSSELQIVIEICLHSIILLT